MIIKYKAEKTFKDKYSKEIIKENDVINVTIERMKELNEKKFGRVIDIIVEDEQLENVSTEIEKNVENNSENDTSEKNKVKEGIQKYSRDELENMTVNQLKDLAESMECELTHAKKEEIIEEIIKFQGK